MAEALTAEQVAEVRLSMTPGVGPRLRTRLVEAFGSAEATLEASAAELERAPGIGPKLAEKLVAAREIDVHGELELAGRHGIGVLTIDDARYPRELHEIPDPPGVLFTRGELLAEDRLAVAIVGSRHATRYGLEQAERLAGGLARAGLTVVSGLARGIDGAAHRGALAAGGRTLAVLAGGLAKIYPPEHVRLADEVAAAGCLFSEAPPRRPPMAGSFPQRNRVISGLSLGVVVIEAAERSGALITVRHAGEQGRDVFAVPGPVTSRLSRGCHRLIQDGAKLVADVDDIVEELGPLVEPAPVGDTGEVRHVAELKLNEIEQQVLQAIDTSPTPIDLVAEHSTLPVPRVLATISILEMRGLVRRVSGALVARV